VSAVKITVPREKCCGTSQCVLAAPELFDQDDNGVVLLLTEVPEPAQVPGAPGRGHAVPGRRHHPGRVRMPWPQGHRRRATA
jgi:4Fe-4S single cluster domain